jgi:hypothetical protein
MSVHVKRILRRNYIIRFFPIFCALQIYVQNNEFPTLKNLIATIL